MYFSVFWKLSVAMPSTKHGVSLVLTEISNFNLEQPKPILLKPSEYFIFIDSA